MALPLRALPWKEIIRHAPRVWDTARHLLDLNRGNAPPLPDPAADLHEQVAAVSAQLQQSTRAQAEQAKVIADYADQMQAMSAQLQELAARARRGFYLGIAGFVAGAAALVVALLR